MKILVINFVFVLFFTTSLAHAKNQVAAKSSDTEVSLGVTHLLPSVFVIPSGKLVLGTSVGTGFLDVIEVSTNLWYDFQQVYNISSKIGLYNSHDFGFAIWGSYFNQTYQVIQINSSGQAVVANQTSTTLTPGFTLSFRLVDDIVTHFGIGFGIQNPSISKASLNQRTGSVQGNVLYHEYGFAMTKTLSFAPGVTYDAIYDIWGAGATLYVGSFQIGGHYYFNVATGSLLPIVGGSYTAEY